MSDLIERLREYTSEGPLTSPFCETCKQAADTIEHLRKIEAAAKNLIAVKGRYHTERAFEQLQDAIGGKQ